MRTNTLAVAVLLLVVAIVEYVEPFAGGGRSPVWIAFTAAVALLTVRTVGRYETTE